MFLQVASNFDDAMSDANDDRPAIGQNYLPKFRAFAYRDGVSPESPTVSDCHLQKMFRSVGSPPAPKHPSRFACAT